MQQPATNSTKLLLASISASLMLAGIGHVAHGDTPTVVSVQAGEHAWNEAPIFLEWAGEAELSEDTAVSLRTGDDTRPAQVMKTPDDRVLLGFLVTMDAGEERDFEVVLDSPADAPVFSWESANDAGTRLVHNGTPVLEYVHPSFDPDNIEDTKKPFHHAFSPDGDRKLTKGLGGLYPHHRGIYFGYNRINFEGGSADIWHAVHGEYSEHRETLQTWAGPVFGGHRVRIDWVDAEGTVFIEETRTVLAFKQSDGEYLIDFSSTLESKAGEIELGGDNHHAGVQFRAAQYVADNSERSRYLRPAEWADLEPASQQSGRTGAPWNALQFTIEGNDYTVAYLTHPNNADIEPADRHEMSERLYGRFGEFIPTTLSPDEPLTFRYRFWVTDRRDTIDREEIDAQHNAYASGALLEQ